MHPSLLPVVLALALVTPPLVVADVRRRRLPNALVASGALGLLASCLAVLGAAPGGAVTVLRAVAAATAVGVLLVAVAICGGLGMGDAKLAAVLTGAAALLDPAGPLLAGLVTAVCGGVSAVAVAARGRRRAARALPDPPRSLAVPYGPALLAGWWAVALAETAGGATTVLTIVAPP
ncbi:prepilin peptidase [Frigoribacterium salinisoli]